MEGDAGTSRLNPTDAAVAESEHNDSEVAIPQTRSATTETAPRRRATRIGHGSAVAVCATLVVLAITAGTGGYLAARDHQDSNALRRAESAALAAAKDCVTATQAPDADAMAASEAKIIECATGDFGAQAALYSSMLVEAYQAAKVKVQVSDLRAAAERHNTDGSVDVLVAVRVQVTNSDAPNQEHGYRLRVRMAPADGTYKIARLDQVTS
jgi:Mce-associated membrane protein